MFKRYAVLFLVVLGAIVVLAAPAMADSPAPGWEIFTRAAPTNLPPEGEGEIHLDVFNVGAATGELPTITDVLPAGATVVGAPGIEVFADDEVGSRVGPGECTATANTVSCTANTVPPGYMAEVSIPVKVGDVMPGSEAENHATVVGGGALGPANESKRVKFSSAAPGFGFAGVDGWFTNADGTNDTQAGSHPYELTIAYAMNSTAYGYANEFTSHGETANLVVNLPPGIIGNPTAVPRCTRRQFDGEKVGDEGSGCPADTQVGVDTARPQGLEASFKVYNLVPPLGVAAQFGFLYAGIPVFLDAGVRSGGPTALSSDYGISEHVLVPQRDIVFNATTIWGVPAEESHTDQRGVPSSVGQTPFLTLPTGCEGPQEVSLEALDTWESSDVSAQSSFMSHDSTGTQVGFTGCDHLGFGPVISAAPDTSHADTPAGLTVDVEAPQAAAGTSEGLSTSDIKDTTVTLPEGFVINPGQATGLVACQASQDGTGGDGPPSCPADSKVGTVEIETPLLFGKLQGNVYILQSNPPELKLLVAASGEGVNLKLIGDVHLNETTGQLATTFTNTPELPFTNLRLSFSGGAQAALATPTECGTYKTVSDFTPWSAPLVGDAFPSSTFAVESGPGGSACRNPLPFAPELIAGATTDQAGGYTGFSMLLSRGDGQQRIEKLQFKTPKGLLGMLSHVSTCGEPQAATGECPSAAQIGHTVTTAGPGPYPFEVPEAGGPPAPIYLTGPYEGAPYGLAIVVPVVAGPFNLGTVVVRARIEVDPTTSQLTITTGRLPEVLDGIPTDLRVIDAVIDRPEFMFNPTNCDPMSFSGIATSYEGATAPLESHFQVGSCRSLTFKPGFTVATSAKTSRLEGASLNVKMTLPDDGGLSATANVAKVKVSLPKQLPTPLTTLQKACLEKTFAANPASCPVASQVGQVKVSTPVLPGGLSGTAYFVSHGGAKYPELILVLVGSNGVTVQVHGETFISKAGITTATFAAVPDVPFSSFELSLPKRMYPALTGNGNLCKGSLVMPTEMVAQNGLVIKQNTKIAVTGCPKAKKAARRKQGKHKAKQHNAKQVKGRRKS
jgi:hypothetical protein